MSDFQAPIMVVEDDVLQSTILVEKLRSWGFTNISLFTNGEEAVEHAKSDHPRIILMDVLLVGKISGIEAARRIQKEAHTFIYFLTANPQLIQPFIQDNWFHDCKLMAKPIDTELLKRELLSIIG